MNNVSDFDGYKINKGTPGYPVNHLKTGGHTGDYLQLIGNIASAIGDSLQAYGQGISIVEDEQQ